MPTMQTANVMVALGGDVGTLVPKYGITVAEIAVLRAIHGEAAVTEIDPTGEIERTNREERERLLEIYGRAKKQGPTGDVVIVADLFPGAAAAVFRELEELDIPAEFYKATGRVAPQSGEGAAKTKKGKKAAAEPKEPDEQPDAFE